MQPHTEPAGLLRQNAERGATIIAIGPVTNLMGAVTAATASSAATTASRLVASTRGAPVGWHLARSVEERGEDGVDLAGGQQGGAVAKAG